MADRHIAVIGGGFSGLSACYDLLKSGQRATLLEATPYLGGLASSIELEGQFIERYYHFICRTDIDLIDFIEELGIINKLHWHQTFTAFYHESRLYSFGTPVDLLFFKAIPWMQRIRFGKHIMQSRYRKHWRWLNQIPAKPWLIENIGEEAYFVIWDPLLKIKFGKYYDKISAAWVWHRIWRVAKSRRHLWEREAFGYLEHGTATLVAQLTDWLITQPNLQIYTGSAVQAIEIKENQVTAVITNNGRLTCDKVISTIALPLLSKLLPNNVQGTEYFYKMRQIKYIGVVCALFNLKQPFSRNFWMNINDYRISFNGVIELSNLNPLLKQAGLNLLYIPHYIPIDSPRYQYSDHHLYEEYTSSLKLINPRFNESWIKERFIFRTPFAQAICTTGFAEQIPAVRTPIAGLYVTDSTQFYPEDRTISAAIRQGRFAASKVLEDYHGIDPSSL